MRTLVFLRSGGGVELLTHLIAGRRVIVKRNGAIGWISAGGEDAR